MLQANWKNDVSMEGLHDVKKASERANERARGEHTRVAHEPIMITYLFE